MAQLTNRKVQASSLIEALIAMVIILVVFAIAMKIFANVMHTDFNFRDIKVHNQLEVLFRELEAQDNVIDGHKELDGIQYEFTIKTTENIGISSVEIKATQGGRLLGTRKGLVHLNKTLHD